VPHPGDPECCEDNRKTALVVRIAALEGSGLGRRQRLRSQRQWRRLSTVRARVLYMCGRDRGSQIGASDNCTLTRAKRPEIR
jgi:hypothetical protein